MDVKNLADELKNKAGEVKRLINRVLPVKAGRMAKDHFLEIYKKCWVDNLPSISSRSGQRPEAFVPVNRMASPDTANIQIIFIRQVIMEEEIEISDYVETLEFI